jgi:heme O synthase-like polyprenyltransferase
MKSTAIEVHPAAAPVTASLSLRAKIGAYVELTKPRITSLIMLTAAAGFCLGAEGGVNYLLLTHAMI